MTASPYRVGVARIDITPDVGGRLGGYAARTGRSTGVAQPLYCTAFAFADASQTVCIAVCDLLYVTADIVGAARRAVAADVGLEPAQLIVTATHTHSGPADLTCDADRPGVAAIAAGIARAIRAAVEHLEPAVIRTVASDLDSISMNRRDPQGPICTTVRSVVAERPDDRSTIGVLANYACHATVLEADNLSISSDFPGAAAAFVERSIGVPMAYLQGCAGQINPVWAAHDDAEVRRLGAVLGSVVTRQVAEGQGAAAARHAVNLSRMDVVEAPPSRLAGTVVDGPIRCAARTVRLRRRPERSTSDIVVDIERLRRTASDAAPAMSVARPARMAALEAERFASTGEFRYWHAAEFDGRDEHDPIDTVEVSGVGFGDSLAVVGIPAEPFLAIGRAIRRDTPAGALLVCGYANGMIGYVPDRDEFAREGYEVGMARYCPDAADAIVAGCRALVADLTRRCP